jgi:hypothetical protein
MADNAYNAADVIYHETWLNACAAAGPCSKFNVNAAEATTKVLYILTIPPRVTLIIYVQEFSHYLPTAGRVPATHHYLQHGSSISCPGALLARSIDTECS